MCVPVVTVPQRTHVGAAKLSVLVKTRWRRGFTGPKQCANGRSCSEWTAQNCPDSKHGQDVGRVGILLSKRRTAEPWVGQIQVPGERGVRESVRGPRGARVPAPHPLELPPTWEPCLAPNSHILAVCFPFALGKTRISLDIKYPSLAK